VKKIRGGYITTEIRIQEGAAKRACDLNIAGGKGTSKRNRQKRLIESACEGNESGTPATTGTRPFDPGPGRGVVLKTRDGAGGKWRKRSFRRRSSRHSLGGKKIVAESGINKGGGGGSSRQPEHQIGKKGQRESLQARWLVPAWEREKGKSGKGSHNEQGEVEKLPSEEFGKSQETRTEGPRVPKKNTPTEGGKAERDRRPDGLEETGKNETGTREMWETKEGGGATAVAKSGSPVRIPTGLGRRQTPVAGRINREHGGRKSGAPRSAAIGKDSCGPGKKKFTARRKQGGGVEHVLPTCWRLV